MIEARYPNKVVQPGMGRRVTSKFCPFFDSKPDSDILLNSTIPRFQIRFFHGASINYVLTIPGNYCLGIILIIGPTISLSKSDHLGKMGRLFKKIFFLFKVPEEEDTKCMSFVK